MLLLLLLLHPHSYHAVKDIHAVAICVCYSAELLILSRLVPFVRWCTSLFVCILFRSPPPFMFFFVLSFVNQYQNLRYHRAAEQADKSYVDILNVLILLITSSAIILHNRPLKSYRLSLGFITSIKSECAVDRGINTIHQLKITKLIVRSFRYARIEKLITFLNLF
jgi:hypothetical protein